MSCHQDSHKENNNTQKINRINYAENFIRNLTSLDVVRVRDDDRSSLYRSGRCG
jgi:PP-loop superfamily ATP-utilizing enzyme